MSTQKTRRLRRNTRAINVLDDKGRFLAEVHPTAVACVGVAVWKGDAKALE